LKKVEKNRGKKKKTQTKQKKNVEKMVTMLITDPKFEPKI